MITNSNQGTVAEPGQFTSTLPHIRTLPTLLVISIALLQACTGINTFPMIARPGDTVSVMVGGSEAVRKNTISASLTDSASVVWDLQALGKIRSVFNLRPDGRSYGQHYSDAVAINEPWRQGHEPVQTVLVFDVPDAVAIGAASVSVNLNASDNSSGAAQPSSVSIDIVEIPGLPGTSDDFTRLDGIAANAPLPVNFSELEPAPYAKISFGDKNFNSGVSLGATELVVDFDEAIVNGDDINVYVAGTTTQRGSVSTTAPFGDNQRMVYWKQDGSQIFITVIAPTGIKGKFLQIYIIHPRGLVGDPGLNLVSTTSYDLDGNNILVTPLLNYYP